MTGVQTCALPICFAPDTLPANAPHAEFVKATDAMNERLDALDLNEVEIEGIEEPKE